MQSRTYVPSRPVPSHFVLISSFANRFARGVVGAPPWPSGCKRSSPLVLSPDPQRFAPLVPAPIHTAHASEPAAAMRTRAAGSTTSGTWSTASGTGQLTPAGQRQELQITHVGAARASRPRKEQTQRDRLYRRLTRGGAASGNAILHGLARRTAPQTQGSAPGAAQAVGRRPLGQCRGWRRPHDRPLCIYAGWS